MQACQRPNIFCEPTCDRHQGVDWHALWVLRQRGQLVDQPNPVLGPLSQADNAACADADARLAHAGDGVEPILEGSRQDVDRSSMPEQAVIGPWLT